MKENLNETSNWKQILKEKCPTVEVAKKIASIGKGILVEELENTIKKFPALKKSQILRLFENEACIKKQDSISGGRILRETLLDIIERLENYTGKKITRDCDAPLRYLEDTCQKDEAITIEDIADYFSGRGGRIEKLIIFSNSKPVASRQTVKNYLADSCGISANELNEGASITSLIPSVEAGEKSYYIIIYWLEEAFNKTIPNSFVEQKTVKELIDYFTEK